MFCMVKFEFRRRLFGVEKNINDGRCSRMKRPSPMHGLFIGRRVASLVSSLSFFAKDVERKQNEREE